jgi:hypothetical protein
VKRVLIAPLAVVSLLAVAAGPAMADRDRVGKRATAPAPPAGGGGQMQVNGAGNVRVVGNFMTWGDVRGMTVRVTDRYGDALVQVGKRKVMRPIPKASGRLRRTITIRPGPAQRVRIVGCRAEAVFRGNGNVMISISGEGRVRLDGVGTFTVNDRPSRSWPLRPVTVRLAPTAARGRG